MLIGMGSNIEPERHLTAAAREIREAYPAARFSSVYRSPAVGMEGDDFLNACCLIDTDRQRAELDAWLKRLEDRHGRDRTAGSWRPRTLDLDLIFFGMDCLDPDLYRYAHVHVPAAELVELEAFAGSVSMLRRVALDLSKVGP
ncbi:MAG TPA: 2-amino-4-hydroxy-6-hydroxymethyldihydropteridine diphosphokinase [Mariprofundaceae bacterium]|nr:2-amino-4-hydroxy-6-hydroxymethyldihydropteridine diphosphokinase [Mariprofundaceae bacterium]